MAEDRKSAINIRKGEKPSSARREIIKNKNNIIVNTPSTKLK